MKKIRISYVPQDDAKLPKTRGEQFKQILKDDFRLVFDASLILGLFLLPLLIDLALEFSFISLLKEINFNSVFTLVFYFSLGAIPLFAIYNLAKGSVLNIFKNRLFNKGFFFISEFFKGIKTNFKNYFINGLILGLIYFVCSCGVIFFLFNSSSSALKGIGIGVCLLFFLISLAIDQFFLESTNYYELNFGGHLKNSIYFSLINFPMSLVYFLIVVALPVGLAFIHYLAIGIYLLIFVLFLDGLFTLLEAFYILKVFNKYINEEAYKEYVNLGLAKEEK